MTYKETNPLFRTSVAEKPEKQKKLQQSMPNVGCLVARALEAKENYETAASLSRSVLAIKLLALNTSYALATLGGVSACHEPQLMVCGQLQHL